MRFVLGCFFFFFFLRGSTIFWNAASDADELGDTPFADSHMCGHALLFYAEMDGLELFCVAGAIWIYLMGEVCFSR